MVQNYMLRTKRQFFIDRKAIFEKAIIAFAACLPDPDKMECEYVNDWIIKRMWEEKFSKYLNCKQSLYKAAFKIWRCMMGHGVEHRVFVDFIIEEIVEAIMDGEWKPREIGYPGHRIWKEPRTEHAGNYGGFHGRRFVKLIGRHTELAELYRKHAEEDIS